MTVMTDRKENIMFKKPNRFQEYPLDYKKYKTPDHFEGLIFKGFIGTSIKDDKTNVYLNLIKIYKNDVHHWQHMISGRFSEEHVRSP